MNELKIFENEQFGTIRTVEIDNTPYFVGKEISKTAKMTVLKVIEGLPSSTKADFTALFFQANFQKQRSLSVG